MFSIVRYCNTAYPEKEVLIETMKLLDELVAVPSQMREPEINETYLLLTLKEVPYFLELPLIFSAYPAGSS